MHSDLSLFDKAHIQDLGTRNDQDFTISGWYVNQNIDIY